MEKKVEKEKKVKEPKESKEVVELKNTLAIMNDKFLRLQAEFINFKNRTEVEKERLLKYEGENFIKDLLIIVDNFESAIKLEHDDISDEVGKFLSGFKMIYANLINLLDQIGVKEIEVLGLEFNPHVAEAVMTEEDKDKPAGVVLEVYTKGYMYKDKVLRPAMVKVNK